MRIIKIKPDTLPAFGAGDWGAAWMSVTEESMRSFTRMIMDSSDHQGYAYVGAALQQKFDDKGGGYNLSLVCWNWSRIGSTEAVRLPTFQKKDIERYMADWLRGSPQDLIAHGATVTIAAWARGRLGWKLGEKTSIRLGGVPGLATFRMGVLALITASHIEAEEEGET